MKKIYITAILFVVFTAFIKLCPTITLWDKSFIIFIQNILTKIPLTFAVLPDCKLYVIMIILPIFCTGIGFFKIKKYFEIIFFASIPLVTFLLNCGIKPIIHRARPPFELQQLIHPDSFSYVSSHSLVTFCLWGMVIYYANKYLKNKILKIFITIFSSCWICYVGLSRIWLGVHNPTDVLGAYILGILLVFIYVKIGQKYEKSFGCHKF